MIIDAHNHPDWHGRNLEKTLENMDQYGISKTWLLTWEGPKDDWDPNTHHVLSPQMIRDREPISLERCVSYCERAPERFVLGYAPDPRVPGACDRLRAAHHIHNARICGELKLRMMLDDWDAIDLYNTCAELKMPVTVHIDYKFPTANPYPRPNYWYGGGIEAFERAIAACPNTLFLGHAPGFWAHISGDDQYDKTAYPKGNVLPGGKIIQMLDTYKNLYCDMSAGSGCNALSRDIAFTKQFLVTYQDRILYARDYFDNAHQELLNSLGLPQSVLDKIYYQNAEKILTDYLK